MRVVYPGHLINKDNFTLSLRQALKQFFQSLERFAPVSQFGSNTCMAILFECDSKIFQLLGCGQIACTHITECELVVEIVPHQVGFTNPTAAIQNDEFWLPGIHTLRQLLLFSFSAYDHYLDFMAQR